MAVSKVDKTGRVYIPSELREVTGISSNELVDVIVDGERLIVERRKNRVAARSRGLFKLKKHVEDVDVLIRKNSLRSATRELCEIRRR